MNSAAHTLPDSMEPDPYGKVAASADVAVADIRDGATIMVAGFGDAGFPFALRDALGRRRAKNLTVIANNANFEVLTYEGGLQRLICSYPIGKGTAAAVREAIEAGRIELLLTPQGTLVEQIRAAAAGLGGVLTPTALGTDLAERFKVVECEGVDYLLVPALHADVGFVRAAVGDYSGNLCCRLAARNFNPAMAMAASYTIAQVDSLVPVGAIDPDRVHIPAPFVDRMVVVPPPAAGV